MIKPNMDALVVDFRKVLRNYRILIFRFQFYRMAYRLKVKGERKGKADEEEENSRKIRAKALGFSAAVVLLVFGIVLLIGYKISMSEFH